MIEDRHSASWLVFPLIGLGMIAAMNFLEMTPDWLVNLFFILCCVLVAAPVFMFGVSVLHQRLMTTGQSSALFGFRDWTARILNHEFAITMTFAGLVLIVVALMLLSLLISPSEPNDRAERLPLAVDIDRSAKTKSTIPDIPPRTPQDLLVLYRTQTWRDVMRYKGMWMRVEGTVRDIGEVIRRKADPTRTPVIQVTLTIGSRPHDAMSNRIEMFVDADQGKPKLDQLRRGDWVEARGIVDHVSSRFVGLINGEILSSSRSNGNRR